MKASPLRFAKVESSGLVRDRAPVIAGSIENDVAVEHFSKAYHETSDLSIVRQSGLGCVIDPDTIPGSSKATFWVSVITKEIRSLARSWVKSRKRLGCTTCLEGSPLCQDAPANWKRGETRHEPRQASAVGSTGFANKKAPLLHA